jgi:transposase
VSALRTGNFRVAIKSMDAQTLRMLLMARAQIVSQRQEIGNHCSGPAQDLWAGHSARQQRAVCQSSSRSHNAALAVIVEPLLLAWQALREQVANFDQQVNLRAKIDITARRLMTIPGVGVRTGSFLTTRSHGRLATTSSKQ